MDIYPNLTFRKYLKYSYENKLLIYLYSDVYIVFNFSKIDLYFCEIVYSLWILFF